MHSSPLKLALFATTPESMQLLSKAVPPNFDFDWRTTVEEAAKLLDRNYDVIVCCIQFDSSRVFEMLELCKASPRNRETPFICVRTVGGRFDDMTYKAMEVACRASGATDFVDLCRMIAKDGREQALNTIAGRLCAVAEQGGKQRAAN